MAETTTCTRCGATMTPGASPQGLCARCLLQVGLESKGSAADVVHTGQSEPRKPPPTLEELAPHFPQLELLALIGQGGMGAVYKARQRELGREVALKILAVDASADASFAERFGREAKTLASLSHPNLVHVHDFGRAGPWFYFVMEFIDGASLRQMLRAKTVTPREALSIVGQMCDALQYAHDEGVVHRDIKPENVLVGRRGQVKVLDFGLAKLTGTKTGLDHLTKSGQAMGTPYYMAPEQWEHPLEVDHRADIYSLGVVFYELLTGELPVGRFAPPSQRIEVDVRLDDVVVKTLEREPERRYQQASQVKTDMQRIAASPGSVPPPVPAAAGGGGGDAWHAAHGGHGRHGGRGWMVVLVIAGLALIPIALIGAALLFALAGRKQVAGAAVQQAAAQDGALDAARRVEEGRFASWKENADRVAAEQIKRYLEAKNSKLPDGGPLRAPGELGPKVQPGVGREMGLDPDEIDQVNRVLADAYAEYRDLEARHSSASRTADGHVHVVIEPFAQDWKRISETVADRLKLVLPPGTELEKWWIAVNDRQALWQQMPYGHSRAELEIWLDKPDTYQWREVRGEGPSRTQNLTVSKGELPLEQKRFWDMGSALPPK